MVSARGAARRFFDQTEPIFVRLGAPSEPGSNLIIELLPLDLIGEQPEDGAAPLDEQGLKQLRLSVNRGYAMRLAEGTDALPMGLPGDDAYEAMTRLLVDDQLFRDDRMIASVFSPGEKVWRLAADGWTRMVNVMLQDDDPEATIFLVEPIDQAMRMGYVIAAVDQAFGLSPTWRDERGELILESRKARDDAEGLSGWSDADLVKAIAKGGPELEAARAEFARRQSGSPPATIESGDGL